MVEEIVKKTVSETSRLSGLGVEKYLIANEIISHATTGSLYVGNMPNFKGYVTNNRLIFYKREGLIIKSDIFNDVPLNQIEYYKIVEEGIVFKKMFLELNGALMKVPLKINGDRSDILELYRAIQAAKQKYE